MTAEQSPKRKPEDYITVTVLRITYEEIKKYFDEVDGNGVNMGSFYDRGAQERFAKIKSRNTPFDLISTDTFIKAGWEKTGSSTYKRGDSIAMYTGTFWYCDGVQLTKDNWYEKIGDKSKAKINPNIPLKK